MDRRGHVGTWPNSSPPLLRLWRSFIPSKSSVWSQIAVALSCLGAIVIASRMSQPYYVSREPIGAQLIQHPYVDSSELRAPWMHRSAEFALKTPRFLLDRELFAMDLLRTGHVTVQRAWALADVAVREAYTRRIPPALVLGVMLTENDELKSSAKSRIGAIGLMQVYPKHWAGALGRKFGTNIHTDSTNLKYGIFILGWVTGRAVDRVDDRDDAWRKALLALQRLREGVEHAELHQLSRRRPPAGAGECEVLVPWRRFQSVRRRAHVARATRERARRARERRGRGRGAAGPIVVVELIEGRAILGTPFLYRGPGFPVSPNPPIFRECRVRSKERWH